MNKEQEKLIEELTPEQAREMVEAGIALKKHLKALSKNQLIALLVKQVNITIEQQNVNKILADRLGLGEKNV